MRSLTLSGHTKRVLGTTLVAVAGALAWSAGACAVAACGGSSSTTTSGGSAPIPQDQLTSQAAHAICDNLGACCQKYSFAYDPNGCAAGFQATLDKSIAHSADAGLTYNSQAAGDCVAALRNVAQTCPDNKTGKAQVESACAQVFVGTKQAGEPCGTSAECAPPPGGGMSSCTSTSTDAGNSMSTCVQRPLGNVGDTCAAMGSASPASVADCSASGLICDQATAKCVQGLADGQPCKDSGQCSSHTCTGGTCVTARPYVDKGLCGSGS